MKIEDIKSSGLRQGLLLVKAREVLEKDETKPWGGYAVYECLPASDKKILYVRPTRPEEPMVALSLQRHGVDENTGHSEYWHFFSPALVVMGSSPDQLDLYSYQPGDNLFIPGGRWHALCTPRNEVIVQEERISPTNLATQGYLGREENITREFDMWRTGKPWPTDLISRINSRI